MPQRGKEKASGKPYNGYIMSTGNMGRDTSVEFVVTQELMAVN